MNRQRPENPEQSNLTPVPWDRAETQRRAINAQIALGKAKRETPGFFGTLGARIGYLNAKLNLFRPMRAFQSYTLRHGPILAAGSAYSMFFSVAAMLVAGFSVFGIIVSGNRELQNLVIETVSRTTPGLIADENGNGGLAKPADLFGMSQGFSIALVISVAALLFTSLGWISNLRAGIRAVFGLEAVQGNPVLRIVKDVGILLALGVALVVTSVVGFGASAGLEWVLQQLDLDNTGFAILGFAVSLAFTLLLDFIVAAALFRFAAEVQMPRGVRWQTALIAAAGSSVLRLLSGYLLANVAGSNSLLAPFSVILGLFVWFYLLSQVYLIAAGWGTVGAADVARKEENTKRPSKNTSTI